MATGFSSNLWDVITCHLCCEQYNDSNRLPKSLPCLHTFCIDCMVKYHRTRAKPQLPCPICQEVFNVPKGGMHKLRTSYMVRQLLDKAPMDDFGSASWQKCKIHKTEKCDLYCCDCKCFLCIDCILQQVSHKKHSIIKRKDVVKYKSDFERATVALYEMQVASKNRVDRLTKELVACRDSLLKQADGKLAQAQWEAQMWHNTTTAAIFNAFHDLHGRLIETASKTDLQEVQMAMEKLELDKINSDLKGAQNQLDVIKSHITVYNSSSQSSPEFWNTDLGTITKDFVIDLGHWTGPAVCLPDTTKFPFSMTDMVNIFDAVPKALPTKHLFDRSSVEVGLSTALKSILRLTSLTSASKSTSVRLPAIDTGSRPASAQLSPSVGPSEVMLMPFKTPEPTLKLVVLYNYKLKTPCHLAVALAVNEALVTYKNTGTIRKVLLKSGKAIELKQKALPDEHHLSYKCEKYILTNRFVLLREYHRGPCYILNDQLELISIKDEDYGKIIAAMSQEWVAFDTVGEVRIYDLLHDKLLQTLKPPLHVAWLSPLVCRHPDSWFTCVVDSHRNLSIYDHNADHLISNQLSFIPRALASNSRHVYIVSRDPVCVAVFSWRGQLVTTLADHQFNITPGQFMHSISVNEDRLTVNVVTVCGDNSVYCQAIKTAQCL